MRFCNADPIGFGGGLNWYAAFGNNPISFSDPLGLKDSKGDSTQRLEPFYVTISRADAAWARQFGISAEAMRQRAANRRILFAGARVVPHANDPDELDRMDTEARKLGSLFDNVINEIISADPSGTLGFTFGFEDGLATIIENFSSGQLIAARGMDAYSMIIYQDRKGFWFVKWWSQPEVSYVRIPGPNSRTPWAAKSFSQLLKNPSFRPTYIPVHEAHKRVISGGF